MNLDLFYLFFTLFFSKIYEFFMGQLILGFCPATIKATNVGHQLNNFSYS